MMPNGKVTLSTINDPGIRVAVLYHRRKAIAVSAKKLDPITSVGN